MKLILLNNCELMILNNCNCGGGKAMVTVVTNDNIHLNGIERKGTVKVRPS